MRLPNKQSNASRSMSVAMRDPVLEGNRIAHQAAVQKFTPMPTNYDDISNAQSRALLSGIRALDSASKIVAGIQEIDYEHQLAAAKAKEAELRAFVGDYYAGMTQDDLQDYEGDSFKRKYELAGIRASRALKAKEEELDKKYGISDSRIKSDYSNARLGIVSSFNQQVGNLVDKHKDYRAEANLEAAFLATDNYNDARSISEDLAKWKSPAEIDKLLEQKQRDIELNAAFGIVSEESPVANSNNLLADEISKIQARISEGGDLEGKAGLAADILSIYESKIRKNYAEALTKISKAELDDRPLIIEQEFAKGNIVDRDSEYTKYNQHRVEAVEKDVSAKLNQSLKLTSEGNFEAAAMSSLWAWKNIQDARQPGPNGEPAVLGFADAAALEAQYTSQLGNAISARVAKGMEGLQRTAPNVDPKTGAVDFTTTGTEAREYANDLANDILKNPTNYGIPKERAFQFHQAVISGIDGYVDTLANNERDAQRKIRGMSETDRLISALSAGLTSPAALGSSSIANASNVAEANKHIDAVYDKWSDNFKVNHFRALETNPYATGYSAKLEVPEFDKVLMFASISGRVPSSIVDSITAVAVNPQNDPIASYNALQQIAQIETVLPGIFSENSPQKGLNARGSKALHQMQWYVNNVGSPFGDPQTVMVNYMQWAEKQSSKNINPEREAKLKDIISNSWSEGGPGEAAYAALREVSPWMPESIPDQMRLDIIEFADYDDAAIGPRYAIQKAIKAVTNNYGVEIMVDEKGEEQRVWVKNSIYKFHAYANQTSPASGQALETLSSWGMNPEGIDPETDWVGQTVRDAAIAADKDPNDVMTVYNPSLKGWQLVHKNGMPVTIPTTGEGGSRMVLIGRDYLSPKAKEARTLHLMKQEYSSALEAHEEFRRQMEVGEITGFASAFGVILGEAFNGDAIKGLDGLIADNLPPTIEQGAEIDMYQKRHDKALEGTKERFVNGYVLDMLNSDAYKKVVHSGSPNALKQRQALIDLTISIAGRWFDAKNNEVNTRTNEEQDLGGA